MSYPGVELYESWLTLRSLVVSQDRGNDWCLSYIGFWVRESPQSQKGKHVSVITMEETEKELGPTSTFRVHFRTRYSKDSTGHSLVLTEEDDWWMTQEWYPVSDTIYKTSL